MTTNCYQAIDKLIADRDAGRISSTEYWKKYWVTLEAKDRCVAIHGDEYAPKSKSKKASAKCCKCKPAKRKKAARRKPAKRKKATRRR